MNKNGGGRLGGVGGGGGGEGGGGAAEKCGRNESGNKWTLTHGQECLEIIIAGIMERSDVQWPGIYYSCLPKCPHKFSLSQKTRKMLGHT